MESIGHGEVKFLNPFMSFRDVDTISQSLIGAFADIPAKEIKAAVVKAFDELNNAHLDMQKKGE